MRYFVATDGTTLRWRTSADSGATWGAAATVLSTGSDKTYLAAAINPTSGNIVVFWSEGAGVFRSRWNGASWGARTAWTNSVNAIRGLAANYRDDFNVIIAGREASTLDRMVWGAVYGDGVDLASDTWSGLTEISRAAAGLGVEYHSPALTRSDTVWRLFYVEQFTGSVAYARLHWSSQDSTFSVLAGLWREPVAFDYEGSTFGVGAALGGSTVWLASGAGVWSAAVTQFADLNVSADVVEASVAIDEGGGKAVVVLDNAGGAYASRPEVRRGARLQLSPGYVVEGSPAFPTAWSFYVEAIEWVTGPRPRVILTCRDGWFLLERWKTRRSFYWALGDRSTTQLVAYVAARAGLDHAEASASTQFHIIKPAFTIAPGESGATAIRRLLATVTDRARFAGPFLQTVEPDAGDAAVYDFGPDDHVVTEARYRDTGPSVNRARVQGFADYAEAFDFADIELGGELIGQVIDENVFASWEAEDRAAIVLRVGALPGRDERLRVFGVYCGLELWDVVSVTDEQAGLSGVDRRVLGFAWLYVSVGAGLKPRYDMEIVLGAV